MLQNLEVINICSKMSNMHYKIRLHIEIWTPRIKFISYLGIIILVAFKNMQSHRAV